MYTDTPTRAMAEVSLPSRPLVDYEDGEEEEEEEEEARDSEEEYLVPRKRMRVQRDEEGKYSK